ncbi:MAG: DUF362 domain-containing protein [Solidesulfovibrio sp.]
MTRPANPENQAENQATIEALNRRDFIKRLAGASALTLGAGSLGWLLADRSGPAATPSRTVLTGLGDFSMPAPAAGKPRLAEVHGTDRTAMFAAAMAALGGMEAFIARGDTVLLKVNAAFSSPPALCATTHPDLLAAVAKACRDAGAAKVLATDNPINSPESCFEITGLAGAARAAGVGLLLPNPALFSPVTLPGAKLITDWPALAGVFKGVTKVIVLSQVKDHHRAGASLSLKNLYGLLGGRRNVFHQDINGVIAELGRLVRPTLFVLDGLMSMMTNGPTGGSLSDLKATGAMFVSADPVATDVLGAKLLGRAPEDLPYLRLAAAAGVGSLDIQTLAPVTINTEPAAG